jgi:adenosylmethionine-8-amino-7-oxononanoate aminotransferase
MWHPLAVMAAVKGSETVIVRGEDCYVWDDGGRRLLDSTAGLWYCHIGHGRPEMADAVTAQMRELETFHTFQQFANPPALELAERLAALSPLGEDAKLVFGSGGSDGVESASKLARLYWAVLGKPGKQTIIARRRSYHGLHGFGTSLGGQVVNQRGFGRLIEDVVHVDTMSAEALEAAIAERGAESVAAFICEPIVGGAGILFPPDDYLPQVQRICRANDVLLIADEVVTGFGRAGAYFASERFGIEPDLLVFAKGVTSGYLPLGGVIVSARVAEPFWADGSEHSFRHGVTNAGHATVCAAALKNLDILEDEDLVARSRALEVTVRRVLEPLRSHPAVVDVRTGAGLVGGVQIADPLHAPAILQACLDRGMLARVIGDADTIQVSPPLTIGEEQLETIGAIVEEALDSL